MKTHQLIRPIIQLGKKKKKKHSSDYPESDCVEQIIQQLKACFQWQEKAFWWAWNAIFLQGRLQTCPWGEEFSFLVHSSKLKNCIDPCVYSITCVHICLIFVYLFILFLCLFRDSESIITRMCRIHLEYITSAKWSCFFSTNITSTAEAAVRGFFFFYIRTIIM